jgi:hypothetical protein
VADAADSAIDALLRAATRRLRLERSRAALARAVLVLLAGLPLLLLWHALLSPVPVTALAVLAALVLLAALAAAAGSVARSEAAEWIDRRLDGASTFGTLLEYAQDARPAAVQLRETAQVRATDCVARLARLPHERSLTRPLLWTSLAALVAGAVVSLTEGRLSLQEAAPSVAQQADDAGAARVGSAAAESVVASARDAGRATGDPATAAAAELQATAAPADAATQVVDDEAGAVDAGLAPGEGDSSSGIAPGREAGSGIDRGGTDPVATSDAQLAVELRKLLGEPTAGEQRTRKDVEGRYDGAATAAVLAGGAAPRVVAAALAPRTLERASLDPATAAFIRAYSDAGPR